MKNQITIGLGLWLGIFGAAQSAQAQDVVISTGVEYTSGNYGGDGDTDVLLVPLSIGLNSDKWNFRASLPYLDINGPGLFLGEDIPILRDVRNPVRGTMDSVSGFGDLSLTAGRIFDLSSSGDLQLELTGRVKIPTASLEDGLSTGETDYSVSGSLFKMAGDWSFFGDLGYRFTGNPDGIELKDTPFAALGTAYTTASGINIGAAYDYSAAALMDVEDAHELSAWVSLRVHKKARLQIYGIAGLSDGGPKQGGGVTLRVTL